jgi:predicted small lipoprotein YifL
MGGSNGPVTHPVLDRALTPRSLRALAAVLAVALALTACSGAGPANGPDLEPAADNTPEPAPPDSTDGPTSEVDDQPPGEDELAATWQAFHTAWVEQAAVDDPDPAAFDQLALDPAAIVELLTTQRGDARLVTTDTELWPRFDIDGENAKVSDCAIIAQHPADQPDSLATITVAWEATATATDDGWRIDDARQGELFCIADELNEQLLDAYRQFRAAKEAAWDPPDPDHPDLERTMAGEQLDFIRELLAEHQRDGIVIRDPAPTDNAVVYDLGIGTATVSDCTEQVPARGAFDSRTPCTVVTG